jgi:glycosyltransferase involved in cell wall biosynthesis
MKGKKADKKLKMIISTSMSQTMATLGQGQISFYRQHGFDVDVFAAKGWGEDSIINEGAAYFEVNFVRDLSPVADLRTLWCLFRLLRQRKPDVIQLMTLKPCILGALAGRTAGVPLIIRHKWGNARECNYKGIKRFLLFSADKMSNKLAHRVVAICHRLKESEIKAGAVDEEKAVVYSSGSSNGLDLNRFKRTPELIEKGKKVKEKLGILPGAPVLGTAMRINIEKGIVELIRVFQTLSENRPNLRLIIIGDYDIRNLPGEDIIDEIKNNPRIYHVGFQANIEDYYAAMDIFVMPSYREGFCKSNIEASGMELPVVATNIIGCSESVRDGVSGILVPSRQTQPLADAIEELLADKQLATKLGKQGRERVETQFDQKFVWHSQLRDICELLKQKQIKPPVEPELIGEKTCPLCDSKFSGDK